MSFIERINLLVSGLFQPRWPSSLWEKVSRSYDEYVTAKTTAYPEIRKFENFEETLVLRILKHLAGQGQNFAFIEAGSGTGRYIEILGSKITQDLGKEQDNNLYSYDEELSRCLKLIVGIDFAKRMVKETKRKLVNIRTGRGNNLLKELGSKVRLIAQPIQVVDEDMILQGGNKELKRFVTCLFGTLGNIVSYEREKAVRRMIEWVDCNGLIMLSVFNRDQWESLGKTSYHAVRGLVGTPKFNDKEYEVTTGAGFYAHWFDVQEAEDIVKITGLPYHKIVEGSKLGIETKRMDSRRGLLIIASTENLDWIDELFHRIITNEHVL